LDGNVEIKLKILHDGEVNRARYNPFDPFVVATKGPSPYVNIFDMSKHPSVPAADGVMRPNLVLAGHDSEGYGLAWSSHATSKGHLISGSEDAKICHWDIHATPTMTSDNKSQHLTLDPISVFKGHTAAIEDVDWHKLDPHLIGSCGDDVTVRIWDVREKNATSSASIIEKAHDGDVHCLSFHPTNEFLLATGSADKTVALWDMRNLKSYVYFIICKLYDFTKQRNAADRLISLSTTFTLFLSRPLQPLTNIDRAHRPSLSSVVGTVQ
jgi:histone-binding protein RBBP4